VGRGSTDRGTVGSLDRPSGVGLAPRNRGGVGGSVLPWEAVPPGGSVRSQPGRVIIGKADVGRDTPSSLSGDSDGCPEGPGDAASTWAPQVRQNHCSGPTSWPFRHVRVTLHSLDEGHSLSHNVWPTLP
jgi:hypothetical protein